MKRKSFALLFAALSAIVIMLAGNLVNAQEVPPPVILPDPEPRWVPGVWTNPDWLTVDFHRVRATIEDQLATTSIDMQFTNTGDGLAEGTFVFPLPDNAAVDRLTMIINGEAFEAKILSATEARSQIARARELARSHGFPLWIGAEPT